MKNNKMKFRIGAAAICILGILSPTLPWCGGAQAHAQSTTRTLNAEADSRDSADDVIKPPNGNGLRLNFRGVALDTVLDYLSKAAGFIIVREATVQGNVDVVSHEPLSKAEAVALLNSVLNKKGFAAVQNERTLTIVTNEEARKRDIPVQMGRDPQKVQKTEDMVTQIIPVTRANVTQLIQNIEPLLPSYAVITANQSSNAIVLTATQTDIRRMMEIIQALDSTMSEVSTFRVFKLKNADATEVARMISDLFRAQNAPASSNTGGSRRGMPPFMMFGGGGAAGASAGNQASGGQSIVQVVAVADTRTNSVVVSAPEEAMVTLERLVAQVDSTDAEITEIRVFPLRYADSEEMAEMIEQVFNDDQQIAQSSGNQGRSSFFRRFMPPGSDAGGPSGGGRSPNANSSRAKVNAVADVRTNSLVVNAEREVLEQIGHMVTELDDNPAKDRKVFVYPLKYADPEETALLLQDMFGGSGNQGARRNNANRNSRNSRSSNQNNQNNQRRNSNGNMPGGMGAGLSLGN